MAHAIALTLGPEVKETVPFLRVSRHRQLGRAYLHGRNPHDPGSTSSAATLIKRASITFGNEKGRIRATPCRSNLFGMKSSPGKSQHTVFHRIEDSVVTRWSALTFSNVFLSTNRKGCSGSNAATTVLPVQPPQLPRAGRLCVRSSKGASFVVKEPNRFAGMTGEHEASRSRELTSPGRFRRNRPAAIFRFERRRPETISCHCMYLTGSRGALLLSAFLPRLGPPNAGGPFFRPALSSPGGARPPSGAGPPSGALRLFPTILKG